MKKIVYGFEEKKFKESVGATIVKIHRIFENTNIFL